MSSLRKIFRKQKAAEAGPAKNGFWPGLFFRRNRNILLLIGVCCLVSACGTRPEAPRVLTVAMRLGEQEWNVLRSEVFPLFERENKITLRAVQIESGLLITKLEALQAAGKKEIDVFSQDNMSLAGPAGERHVIGGDVSGIPKTGKNKETARQFIRFMQSRRVQELLVDRLGWPSIRDDAYAQVEDWQKEYYPAVTEALKSGVFRENAAWWPAYAKYVSKAFREIVVEQAPVEPVLKKYGNMLEQEKLR